jgi:hypothetical protein
METKTPIEFICNGCGTKYNPSDYNPDARQWLCSICKRPLPKETDGPEPEMTEPPSPAKEVVPADKPLESSTPVSRKTVFWIAIGILTVFYSLQFIHEPVTEPESGDSASSVLAPEAPSEAQILANAIIKQSVDAVEKQRLDQKRAEEERVRQQEIARTTTARTGYSKTSSTAESAEMAWRERVTATKNFIQSQTSLHFNYEGEEVRVGYMAYRVERSWWSSRLSKNGYLDKKPNALYLFVKLTARNDDKKARSIPSLKLTNGRASFESSAEASLLPSAFSFLDTLNPGVSQTGIVVFDIPQDAEYAIKLSGGFWSSEEVIVLLSPKPL